jgi:hypothetical protein
VREFPDQPNGRSTEHVVEALAAHVQTLPTQLRRSLTWDRDLELSTSRKARESARQTLG